jgi:hypothetical protein
MPHLNLLNIALADQTQSTGTSLGGASWLLTSLTRVLEREVIVVIPNELRKDAAIGRLFHAQLPLDTGGYDVELGLVLPGWLPNPPGSPDWTISVPDRSDRLNPLTLCFSNQMLGVRYSSPEGVRQVVVPSFASAKAVELGVPDYCPPEVLRTMVSGRFHLPGDDAEAALEQGLDAAADRFVGAINRVIDAHLLMAKPEWPLLFFAVDRSSVEYFYLLVRGRDDTPFGVHRAALSAYRVMRVPGAYTPEEQTRFLQHVADESVERLAHRFLSAGLTSIESGLLEVALLQLVIAGEIGTSHTAEALLGAHDVSASKRKNYGKELTYSELLNIILVSLTPADMKPAPEVIGTLNWGRDARNDLMHRGLFAASRDQLRALFRATSLHLEYLAKVKPPAKVE